MNYQRFQSAPTFRIGAALLSGALLCIAVLALASPGHSACSRAGSGAPLPHPGEDDATMVVTYTLDDFDDRVYSEQKGHDEPRRPNDFFGSQGRWNNEHAVITESIMCSATFDCHLSLAYDLSSPGAEGGYWEELGYSYTSTWPVRDLTEFELLRFRVRGDAAEDFPDHFQIEFIGHDWGALATYTITSVTETWQWKTITLGDEGTLDWSRVKHVAVKLVGDGMPDKRGRLLFDDIVLVDLDFSGNLLDLVQRQAFLYFWENRHPDTGFVRDRAVDPFYGRDVASIAAVGFELTAFGIGAEHGWIDRSEAALATHQVLTTLLTLPQGPSITGTAGYRGVFYHMLDIETGLREPDSEVSSIDTALLMAGVLFARQYYTGTNQIEIDIRNWSEALYNRVEWDWMLRTNPEPSAAANQFYMAWKPEYHDCEASGYQNCYEIPDMKSNHGYFSGNIITGTTSITEPTIWNYTTDEILMINLLAIGSPTHGVSPDTFFVWKREPGTYGDHTLYKSWFGQLFAHFVGQMWLDLRDVEEPESHINWWHNSQQAALANRQFAIDQAITCTTYSTQSWGLSTSLGPPDNPTTSSAEGVGVYRGYGAPPTGDPSPPMHDCSVAPYAAAGSIMFLSANPAENEAYQALEHWFYTQPRLWGLYGFRDGFNLEQGWFAHDYIGLDQGMTLLAIENYRTGLVWETMGRDPAVARAINTVFGKNIYLPLVTNSADEQQTVPCERLHTPTE
jgi:hypothetical protein